MKPTGQLVRVRELSSQHRDQMYALMDSYYENMDRARFDADLDEKEWVILVLDQASNELKGFSTQVLVHVEVDGRSIRSLFSGDTVVAHQWRGQQQLFQISGLVSAVAHRGVSPGRAVLVPNLERVQDVPFSSVVFS